MDKKWWILIVLVLLILGAYFAYISLGDSSDGGFEGLCGQENGIGICKGKVDGTLVPSCDECNTCECRGGVARCTEIAC